MRLYSEFPHLTTGCLTQICRVLPGSHTAVLLLIFCITATIALKTNLTMKEN